MIFALQEEYSRREEPTNGEQYSPVRAEPRKTHDTLRELETPHTGPAANKNSHRIKLVSVVKCVKNVSISTLRREKSSLRTSEQRRKIFRIFRRALFFQELSSRGD